MIKVRASQVFTPEVDVIVEAKKALDEGQSFVDVVKNYSTCPSKEADGDLGWMPEENAMSLLGGDVVSPEDQGKVLGPIHSPYGYHLIKVTEVDVQKVSGPFSADTLMKDINQLFPDVHTLLFKQFHIGFPVSGYKEGETLESVANAQGKSVDEILARLNVEYGNKGGDFISPEELDAKMSNKNIALLDIRESWEWDIAHIKGATLITQENCESVVASLKPEQEIILVDWKGERTASFIQWVREKGFSNVKGIEGGIDAWSDKVDPKIARYEIDQEDEDYRYEDIFDDQQ